MSMFSCVVAGPHTGRDNGPIRFVIFFWYSFFVVVHVFITDLNGLDEFMFLFF